ncbi:LysE family translocator [Cytobacillus spongiae]|uniref:LysE family transporter n=1 Tax=Cytobacillus spongiae TaxID=2901381 RepID=UPI001F3E06A9|nr:LysE family transporter [Cytobacillus spongiae]UII54246.1 LysE family translocator [Cytobacillus spongiae]
MSIFFSYMFLGISLAAPIGPINAAQLDRGIKNGFWHAWMIGLGSVTADIVYMLMVYFGMVHLIEYPIVKIFLYTFGLFVLIYTGIESILSSGSLSADERNRSESIIKTFVTGFFMSITNPLTILFWLGIYGSVLANTASKYPLEQLIMYSSAILLGLLLWDFVMATIASGFRKVLTKNVLVFISVVSGITLIGFGLYFGYQAFVLLFEN